MLSITYGAAKMRSIFSITSYAMSVITYGEVYEGIHYGKDVVRNQQIWSLLLRVTAVLNINRTVAERFAIIRGTLRRQGQLIDNPDILIAATALEHDLILVTRNDAHFARVPGLRLLSTL